MNTNNCSNIFFTLQMGQKLPQNTQSKHHTILRVVMFCFEMVYGCYGRKMVVMNGYVDEGCMFAIDVRKKTCCMKRVDFTWWLDG